MSIPSSSDAVISRDGAAVISHQTAMRMAIVGALMIWAFWYPIRHLLVGRWLADANWSHGWLIPVFSVYLLVSRREELARAVPKANYFGVVILAGSVVMYFISGWVYRMGYPQALSLVTAIFGVTLLMGGREVMRIAWFPIAFLVLAVPLPARSYVYITQPMRELASSVSAAVMPLFANGLHTEAQAVVIDYIMPGRPPARLNVEEACSGMRLTMAFVTLGVMMAYLGRRPNWQRVIMVLSTVPIAIFCNTIRVTVTGLLYVHQYEQLARGTPHLLLGIAMLGLALGLFYLLGYVLSNLVVEVASEA